MQCFVFLNKYVFFFFGFHVDTCFKAFLCIFLDGDDKICQTKTFFGIILKYNKIKSHTHPLDSRQISFEFFLPILMEMSEKSHVTCPKVIDYHLTVMFRTCFEKFHIAEKITPKKSEELFYFALYH
jgi:hypothetical protein